ncbi:MAG: hypothetical protein JWP97_578 [Labilithrix sp.]|nr:hypothetical protein [Labilithrix sp.]
MRIVAAEDDDQMARLLQRCLKSWGYETILARNGHEAWKILKQADAPRLAILDWDMPVMSGVDVCRMLRTTPHGKDVYVLMLTGRQEKDDVVQALETGADDFLQKPFDARELQLRLAKGVRDTMRNDQRRTSTVPPAGSLLDNKFRLEKLIARGGMGTVWLGVHVKLGVNVAIKFMDAELAESADFSTFDREARAAAQLRNEHIVRIYDHGIDSAGLPYLVMEYLSGESLSERIQRLGPLSSEDVAAVGEQTARALSEAHSRGIVHRDIKPENILLVDDPDRACGFCVKVIDFGLADPSGARDNNGEPGMLAGTLHYLSPEYLGGDAGPDSMLDLWALTVTLFHAATGRLAFDGETVNEIYAKLTREPYPVPSYQQPALGRAFDAWFERATSPHRHRRFQTAQELALALVEACKQASTSDSGIFLGPAEASLATEPDLRSIHPDADAPLSEEGGVRIRR